jgi:hypothetical protein
VKSLCAIMLALREAVRWAVFHATTGDLTWGITLRKMQYAQVNGVSPITNARPTRFLFVRTKIDLDHSPMLPDGRDFYLFGQAMRWNPRHGMEETEPELA